MDRSGQPDFFDSSESSPPVEATGLEKESAPLADRMRPRSLDEVLGLENLIGEGAILRRALEKGRLPSLLFWGPPGSGKTTLARVLAGELDAEFREVSAVESGVKQLREVIDRARASQARGRRTILFIDEIHRFNKSQQDAILPAVESGLVTLIGATTENPSFEVNAPLRSRSHVIRLPAMTSDKIRALVDRALADPERGLGGQVELPEEAAEAIVRRANGDARIALNLLEAATDALPSGEQRISAERIEELARENTILYDRASG
ncbi:MAG TPA: AAA family ATPase, partial [bacterium]|nr:AAA family ATPase [bacterium]